MPRVSPSILLVVVMITGTLFTSGCTLTPIVNNTTATPLPAPIAQRQNLAAPDTIPAIGHVYLDGKPVGDAYVMAVSLDGTDSVLTATNESGDYLLNVRRGVWYRVNATYQGLQHTVWPVYLPETYACNEFDINLSKTPRSAIEARARDSSAYRGRGVWIEAVPQNASAQLTAVTDDAGQLSLTVKPDTYYYLEGYTRSQDDKYMARYFYRNGEFCNKVKVGSGETVLLDYEAFPVFSGGIIPVQPPRSPVTASGHVFIEGREAGGAIVEAVSFDGSDRITTGTDENGYYQLNLESWVPYTITARFMGLRHTVWPVYLRSVSEQESQYYDVYYDSRDRYDINLTFQPRSTIEGTTVVHHIRMEATPWNGSGPISAVSGYNRTYALDVQPGVRYTLTAADYYGQLHIYPRFQGRNGYDLSNFYDDTPGTRYFHGNIVAVGPNETALINDESLMPM